MKILHFLTSLEIGGAQRVRLNLINQLISCRPDLEHYLAYFQTGPMLPIFSSLCVKTIGIKGLIYKYDLLAYCQLYNFIKDNSIDLIHSALWASNVFTKLLSINTKCPAILDLHCKRNLLGVKWQLEQFLNWLPEISLKRVAVSLSVGQSYNYRNITVINNGINPEDFKFNINSRTQIREKLKIDSKTFVIGSIGRLEPEKNFLPLIEELKNVSSKNIGKDVLLLIIGHGSEKQKILDLITMLQMETFVKILPATIEIAQFYNVMDSIVLNSVTEGLPMVVLEALANGLPIILPEELLTIELPGCYFFKRGKLAQTIDFVRREKSKTERCSMLTEIFTVKKMTQSYLDLYLSI